MRLALYKIALEKINLAEFLQPAATAQGIYSKHLQRLESILQQQPELWDAMQKVASSNSPVKKFQISHQSKLKSLTLLNLQKCI